MHLGLVAKGTVTCCTVDVAAVIEACSGLLGLGLRLWLRLGLGLGLWLRLGLGLGLGLVQKSTQRNRLLV
ncbi:MAG: hypothetical protein KAI47_26680, partial [Deltaproteobacteria bacterium]|nr:hypothetical protein [Deltaproteobacteria bacterium]